MNSLTFEEISEMNSTSEPVSVPVPEPEPGLEPEPVPEPYCDYCNDYELQCSFDNHEGYPCNNEVHGSCGYGCCHNYEVNVNYVEDNKTDNITS